MLNASDALFVDVDRPEAPRAPRPGLLARLFGRSAPPPGVDDAERTLLEVLERLVREDAARGFRVYRTRAGFRVLATHATFDPLAEEKRVANWLARYDRARAGYATCEILTTVGSAFVAPELVAIVEHHDRATGCGTGRPLA